jgi:DNA-binding transcriptional ArsR family regulator
MQHLARIHDLEAARAALHPSRVQLLAQLREPHTCAELAQALGHSPQRVHNHLKELLRLGLIRVTRRRRVKHLTESTYQAVAKAFWLSPRLVRSESARGRDRLALHELLTIAETMNDEVAALLERTEADEIPSLAFDVALRLHSAEQRAAFARDVLTALRPVIEKYQGPANADHPYKLRLVCYPSPEPTPATSGKP